MGAVSTATVITYWHCLPKCQLIHFVKLVQVVAPAGKRTPSDRFVLYMCFLGSTFSTISAILVRIEDFSSLDMQTFCVYEMS